MHPIFSVTLFTGQQLVLEALQRWLTRPCVDADAQRQRRLGLKSMLSLLVKTTATGVLATMLDAAIEFRRRQLLAAAAAEPEDGAAAGGSRFPGLGMLSRAGIASWKNRLLLCIDELERRAEAYGIGGWASGARQVLLPWPPAATMPAPPHASSHWLTARRRCLPSCRVAAPLQPQQGCGGRGGGRRQRRQGCGAGAAPPARQLPGPRRRGALAAPGPHRGAAAGAGEARRWVQDASMPPPAAPSVQQHLVAQAAEPCVHTPGATPCSHQRLATFCLLPPATAAADAESQRRLDDEVGSLVDLLLGTASLAPAAPPAATTPAAPSAQPACRSRSVPAALDRLGCRREAGAGCGCMRACRSRPALAAAAEERAGVEAEAGSPCGADLCQICMDRCTDVRVAGCQHNLCFGCARRLCASQDHQVPQCPFCRQPIEGFVAIAAACPVTCSAASSASCLAAAGAQVVLA